MADRDPEAERFFAAYRHVHSPNDVATRAAWVRMKGELERESTPAAGLDVRRSVPRASITRIAIAALAIAALVALAMWLDVGGAIARRVASSERGEASYQGEVEDPPLAARASSSGARVIPEPPAPTPSPELKERPAVEPAPESAPIEPSPGASARMPGPKPAARKPRPGQHETQTDDATLHAEMALLSAAQSALAAGNPERALDQLDRHASRFPESLLAEEREVARIHALCDLGRVSDLAKARRSFDKRFPGSPLRGRARAACDEGSDAK